MYSAQAQPQVNGASAERAIAPGGGNSQDLLLAKLEAIGVRWRTMPDDYGADGGLDAQTAHLDLLVYADPHRSWWRRAFSGFFTRRLVERIDTSMLLVRQPRWPIRHILLIVRAEPTDWAAFDWIMRFAQPHRTAVSILPVVPPWPYLHAISRYTQPAPNILLAPNTDAGAMLRNMRSRFQQKNISTGLLLCSGEPGSRIRNLVATCDPDLVVVAAETYHPLLRWLYGELVGPLLRWIDRPVLIAR